MNIKKSIALVAFSTLLIGAPILLATSCASKSSDNSNKVDSEKFNFNWTFDDDTNKKTILPSEVKPNYISKYWYSIDAATKGDPEYNKKYEAPSIKISNQDDKAGTLSLNVTFANSANVSYLSESVTSVSTNISGLEIKKPGVYNFNWTGPSASDLNRYADDALFTKDYVWNNWMKIDQGYKDKYKGIPDITLTKTKSTSEVKVGITFKEAVSVEGVMETSASKTYSNFKTPVTTHEFNWIEPNAHDKSLYVNDSSFTKEYAWEHWMHIDQKYKDDYPSIPDITFTPNLKAGSIKVSISFKTNVMIDGHLKSQSYKVFNGFKELVYHFSWKGPSVNDRKKMVDNKLFTNDYIWNNWVNIDQLYKDNYPGTPKITIKDNKSAGTKDVTINFKTEVLIDNQSKLIAEDQFTGFTTPPTPVPPKYKVSWKIPSVADKTLLANDSSFTDAYILKNWVNIDQAYSTKYGDPTVAKTYDLTKGTITVQIDFKTDVTFNSVKTKTIKTTFSGFQTPATIYNVSWLSPSANDKKLLPDDSAFTDKYILAHWVKIDQAYYTKYGNPSITRKTDSDKGSIDLTINFQTKVTFKGNTVNSISTTFTGFKTKPTPPPPPVTNAWMHMKYAGQTWKTFGKFSEYEDMSLIDQGKQWCTVNGGLEYTDIKSIDYKNVGSSYNPYIMGQVTINFNQKVANVKGGTDKRTSWSFKANFINDPASAPKLQVNAMSASDKASKLPSQITTDYIETNLITLIDNRGKTLSPKDYISKINLHPNDEGGFLEYSIIFKAPISRKTPKGADDDDYSSPSNYWNINVSGLKTNGKQYMRRTGYYPDWAQYGGHAEYKLPGGSDVDNFNDYIFCFIRPDETTGHIQYYDAWGDFNSPMGASKYGGTYAKKLPGGSFQLWPNSAQHFGRVALDNTMINGGIMGEMDAAKSVYGFQTSMSIGGWSYRHMMTNVMSDASKRTTMINDIVNFVARWGYDNVDIDWEYPTSADKANYVSFVKELRETLDASNDPDVRNTTISAALSVNQTNEQAGLSPELNNYVDYFNLMSYDMHGSFDNFFGNMTSLDSDKLLAEAIVNERPSVVIEGKTYTINNSYFSSSDRQTISNEFLGAMDFSTKKGVDYLTKTLHYPSNKILIGGAFYTRGFITSPSQGTPIKELPGMFTRKTGTFAGDWEDSTGTAGSGSYAKMVNEAKGTGWKLYTDPVSQAQYYYNNQTGKITTTDTPYSITQKTNYVKSDDLGGMIVWDISGEWDGSSYNHGMSNIMKSQMNDPQISQTFNVKTYYQTNQVINLHKN